MNTSDQFAQLVKSKYPQYANVDNGTLTAAMLKKYPQYASKVDVSTVPSFGGVPSTAIKGPTGGGNWLTPGGFIGNTAKAITDFGAGVGSAIGKAGLGLGKLAVQAGGATAGMIGDKQGVQGANTIAANIQEESNQMFNQPTQQSAANTPLGTLGKAVGSTAVYASPGGIEKGAGEIAASKIASLPDALGPASKLAKGIATILTKGAIGGTSAAGAAQIQGQNPKIAGIFGGAASSAAGVLDEFGQGFAKSLYKGDFKLTDLQAIKAAKKTEGAASFMMDNKIVGSETQKVSQLQNITKKMETALQLSLPEDVAVSKAEIQKNMQDGLSILQKDDIAAYRKATNYVRQVTADLNAQPGETNFTKGGTVTPEQALANKRSYGNDAFTAGSKLGDPRVSKEGAYIAELAHQKAIEDTFQRTDTKIQLPQNVQQYFGGQKSVSMQDFMKVYSQAISAKNLMFMAQGRNGVSLVGRLFPLWVGKAAGEALFPGSGVAGEILGAVTGEVGASSIGPMGRNIGERVAANPSLIPNITKAGLGTTAALSPSQQ